MCCFVYKGIPVWALQGANTETNRKAGRSREGADVQGRSHESFSSQTLRGKKEGAEWLWESFVV